MSWREIAAGPRVRAGHTSPDHGEPFVGAEQGRLAGMGADRDHDAVGKPRCLADQVDMAVGDGVE